MDFNAFKKLVNVVSPHEMGVNREGVFYANCKDLQIFYDPDNLEWLVRIPNKIAYGNTMLEAFYRLNCNAPGKI